MNVIIFITMTIIIIFIIIIRDIFNTINLHNYMGFTKMKNNTL